MTATRREHAIEVLNQVPAAVSTDPQLAYRLACSATTIDPDMAHGWFGLGNVSADLKMLEASIASFRRVLDLPDDEVTPQMRAEAMSHLAHRLQQAGHVREAHVAAALAIGLVDRAGCAPLVRAFAGTNMSLIWSVLGHTRVSLTVAQGAYEIDQSPIIELGLAFALLYEYQYAEGLRRFESRFAYKLPRYLNYPYPRWDGGPVGTLFVDCDQGIGDTLSFSRFIGLAAEHAEKVLFAVQPEIARLMRGMLGYYGNVEVIPQSTVFPLADAWCPVMSLTTALGLTDADIVAQPGEPVPASADPIGGQWKAPGRKLHVGIAYAGSPLNETDVWRSIPVEKFLRLYEVGGVQLYSLQVGDRVADLHAVGASSLIRDLSPWIRDATDTAALIRQLDLVITVESFVGHLCGAIGTECWVLVSARGGDWRLGRVGDEALWYPNHRLFRQGPAMEWDPVLEDVISALSDRVEASASRFERAGLPASTGVPACQPPS